MPARPESRIQPLVSGPPVSRPAHRATRFTAAILLATLLLAASSTRPAAAWTANTQVAIARNAASIAPPDLKRQIERHKRELQRGALAPFQDGDAARHIKNDDGAGRLDEVILEEVENAIQAIRVHRPFSEIVYRLGTVSHYVADANNPLNTSQADSREGTYFADYLRYVESAQDRFQVVFYGTGRRIEEPHDLSGMLTRTLTRGRNAYVEVGREYRRIGQPNGLELFDDRSTAFGVAALSYSHAVSDVAAVLRYIWIRAGGADPRNLTGAPKVRRHGLRSSH